MGNIKKIEERKLVDITKREAHILNKEHGIPFKDDGISHSYTKHKKFYLCPSPDNMEALKEVRSKK